MAIELNPLYVANLRQMYDVDWGFERVHQDARRRFRRADEMVFGVLHSERLEKFRIFSAKQSAELRKRMDEGIDVVADRSETIEILKQVFTPALDARLIAFFNSEYEAHGMAFEKLEPSEPFTHSDCWHCDSGPTNHLVMMVYLSASEKDGARTIFADGLSTDYMKAAGYIFCPLDKRLPDLTPIFNHFGIPPHEEMSFDVKAGEAIVFQAVNIMHKRQLPKRGPRYVIVLALVPSPVHWLEACETTGGPKKLGAEDTFSKIPEDQLP